MGKMGSEDVFAQDLTLIHGRLPLAITLGRQPAGAQHTAGVSVPQSLQPLLQNSLVINTAYLVYLRGLLRETNETRWRRVNASRKHNSNSNTQSIGLGEDQTHRS